jgi:hypothetical protein
LPKRTIAIFCVSLAMLSSTTSGGMLSRTITPKSIKENKEAFKVETATHNGHVTFKFTRFVREHWYRIGEIVVRRGNQTIVECEVRPAEDKTRVQYEFTMARDAISESEFVLSEVDELKILGGKEGRTMPSGDGTTYHFHLRDYVASSKNSE